MYVSAVKTRSRARFLCGLALLSLCVPSPAVAQKKSASLKQLGVDVVSIKDGPRLRGAVLSRDKAGNVTMAVDRDWLKQASAEFHDEFAGRERKETCRSLTQLQDQTKAWLERRPDDGELQFYLNNQLKRLEKEAAALDDKSKSSPPQFMTVRIPADQVKRLYRQPRARKQVALVAWSERLANVETTSVSELARALRKEGIEPNTQEVDLSDRLASAPQNDRQWAARMAIVEYQFRKPLDFQGTGSLLLRTGEKPQGPNLNDLVGEMLKGELGKNLADLLGGAAGGKSVSGPWYASATKTADKEGLLGVRVTRVNQNLAAKRVSVETRFLARMPGGKWDTVWSYTETANAAQPRPELEARIAKDPQVQKTLGLIKSIGLAAEQNVQLAMRFGAATMEAQQTAAGQFYKFRDRCLRRLSGPPITWPGSQ